MTFHRDGIVIRLMSIWMLASTVTADDWGQFRGPNRDGISQETGLLKEWPGGGPKLLWQVRDLGSGYSTPSVASGKVFILRNRGLEDESVVSLDANDGSEIWSTRIGKVGNPEQRPNYPAARSTPTVVGDVLIALGSDGDLACLDSKTGQVRWQKNLRTEFGGKPGTWAYSESPLVDGEHVVCVPGGNDATIAALRASDGETVWKSVVPGGSAAGYSSVKALEVGGVRQYAVYLADGLVGVDAKTGKLVWQYDRTKGAMGMSIITPVVHQGIVYTGAGRVGGGAVRIASTQGSADAEEVYFSTKLPTAMGGAVVVDNSLYGCGGEVLVCADFASGEILWSERSIAPGSLCFADERLYLHGEDGDMVLLEASREGYREHGRFTPPNQPNEKQGKAWAYPVISNGRLYIRDSSSLWCYDISASSNEP